mgnify:CR=1 FL=1
MPRNKEHLASFRRGEQLYLTTCMACHGPDGQGLPMLGPPLVGSEWTTGSKQRLAAILLQGMRCQPGLDRLPVDALTSDELQAAMYAWPPTGESR